MNTRILTSMSQGLFVVLALMGGSALAANGGVQESTVKGFIEPERGEFPPAPELAPAQREAMQKRLLDIRERYASQVDNHVGEVTESLTAPASADKPTVVGPETEAFTEAYLPFASNAFVTAINNKNTRASTVVGSTLAEPAAINEGQDIFYTGNTHAEYSFNRGATWTAVAIPGGPADAPNKCCDQDVIYDRARGLTIWSVLYTNANQTNGVVKIYVKRYVDTAPACSYTFDPAGTANNTLPDYPHLGLSNKYLYLATNNIGGAAGGRAQVRRINLENMANCVGAAFSVYDYPWSYGQRVFVPVEGAKDVMYWGAMVNSSTFRVYKWPESTTSVTSFDRTVNVSNFTNPDCRGGIGNYDWIQSSTAWTITGFRMRGAVGPQGLAFYWNVGADASHTQGHVHSAVFRESDLAVIAQPHIFNNGSCFGYPAVGVNDRGDFGLSIAYGGKAGGGGSAAQSYVAVDDEYTPGVGYFQTIYLTASGTHNLNPATGGRFGDYFTVRRQAPCGLYFAATNYALNGGTAVANVNARYVEFGRGRDYVCEQGWSNGTYRRYP